MKWDLSTDEGLNAALCFFEAEHDPETARQLATYFYERLKNADVVSIHEPLFIRYFHTVMHRLVADGMKPEQAMGFALQRGKYAREDTESTDIRSAAYVVWARKQAKPDWKPLVRPPIGFTALMREIRRLNVLTKSTEPPLMGSPMRFCISCFPDQATIKRFMGS